MYCIDSFHNRSAVIVASRERISFLSLSTELSNRIYQLALLKDDPNDDSKDVEAINIFEDCREPWDVFGFNNRVPFTQQPQLTRTTRQIRSEALSIYYGQAFKVSEGNYTFWGTLQDTRNRRMPSTTLQYDSNLQEVGVWLCAIGEHNVKLIKRLEIKIGRLACPITRHFASDLEKNITAISAVLAADFKAVAARLPATTVLVIDYETKRQDVEYKRLPLQFT